MANANAKTPNKNRKSLPNLGDAVATPNLITGKLNTSLKTPRKTPNKATPKPTPGQKQKNPQQSPGAISGKKNIRGAGGSGDAAASPPKKLKMFKGTGAVGEQKQKKVSDGGEKKKKRNIFNQIKDKVNGGDKTALKNIDDKIEQLNKRKELTKSAKRKLKLLMKLRVVLTGEKGTPQTVNQKMKEKKKNFKTAHKVQEQEQLEEENTDSEEEVAVPGQIIKSDKIDDDESGEEEDEDDEEEADSDGAPQGVEIPKSGRKINVEYTQGGKKKGDDKKKEMKAKNFKLQAMRKQGLLAGSKNENQKRGARRIQKNKGKVNGA